MLTNNGPIAAILQRKKWNGNMKLDNGKIGNRANTRNIPSLLSFKLKYLIIEKFEINPGNAVSLFLDRSRVRKDLDSFCRSDGNCIKRKKVIQI